MNGGDGAAGDDDYDGDDVGAEVLRQGAEISTFPRILPLADRQIICDEISVIRWTCPFQFQLLCSCFCNDGKGCCLLGNFMALFCRGELLI